MPRPFVRACHHEVIICFSSTPSLPPPLPLPRPGLFFSLRNGILIILPTIPVTNTVATALVLVREDGFEQNHESIASQPVVTTGGQHCVTSSSAPSAGET